MKVLKVLTFTIFGLIISGCAAVPQVRVSGVKRSQIVQVLWEEGGYRWKSNFLGSSYTETVWPSVQSINKPKAVIEYKFHPFLCTTYGKDTIRIANEDSNNVTISLKCEDKTSVLFDFGRFLTPLKRNTERERDILSRTVRRLAEKGASVEWISTWKPVIYKEPLVIYNNDVQWLGCKGVSPSSVLNYFSRKGYKKHTDSNRERTLFVRSLSKNPYDDETSLMNDKKRRTLDWQSDERILIKTIESNDRLDSKEQVVVIGVASKGTADVKELRWGLFWHTTKRTDISQKLQYTLINDITSNSIFKGSGIVFVDPSPWIEEINF